MKNSLPILQGVLFDVEMLFAGCLAEGLGLRAEISGSRCNRLGSEPKILGL